MSAASVRALRATSLVLASLAAACGDATVELKGNELAGDAPFVRIARASSSSGLTASTQQGLDADGGPAGSVTNGNENFYLAINKAQLGQRWFMSAYLTQWYPVEHLPMRSLGTRVVSFKAQNGKLFVFDAADGKGWSETLDPTVVLEAYPVVTDYAPFNALSSSDKYVLVDPSAGLNRFSFVSDDFAASYWARFQVDLSYLQRFRTLADGVSFEQVFTGYTELPGPGILQYEQPFRGSGTLSLTLRRYQESAGFVPTTLTTNHYFWSGWQHQQNAPGSTTHAPKWNVKPGMAPIQWRISKAVEAYRSDPRLAGVDIAGAIERGVEGWNATFGYQVFEVVPLGADDSPGDDDKNFVVVDRNPSAGLAFANWRENPNTGEIRGASVYFSAAFIESALQTAPVSDGGEPAFDAGPVEVDAGAFDAGAADAGPATTPCAPNVVISQVFGGNSSVGVYNQDFVELHNRTDQPVSLAGWSVQYASATGTAWQVAPLAGTIAPGGFFLVGLYAASDGGTSLPRPDVVGSINMGATSGKVALSMSSAPLTPAADAGVCPTSSALVDLVAYGSTATCGEGSPAPAASPSLAVFRLSTVDPNGVGVSCIDTQSNSSDFVAAAPAPRNSASTPSFCVCAAAAPPAPPPAPVAGPDGGTGLVLPKAPKPGLTLSWQAMPTSSTCALAHDGAKALPAGMTRREYIENTITHLVLHEVGHTLGLRHNFAGSLQKASVMDYNSDDDSVTMVAPGAYDLQAIRYLYGLDPNLPTLDFCTDEHRSVLALCDAWDSTATPLTSDIGPSFTAKVRARMAETANLTYADLWRVTRYVRAPSTEAERLQAFDLLVGEVAPPLKPEAVALSANAAAWADLFAQLFLENLFLDPATYRDEVQVNPSLADAAVRARATAVAKGILVNQDGYRTFTARRSMVDVLKAMQTADAFQALREARAVLVSERAGYVTANDTGRVALVDDLVARLDVACTPYFR